MITLTGRQKELKIIQNLLVSHKSEFLAVYGRRRVGKTFLIRQAFNSQFDFQLTGLYQASKKKQLNQFNAALLRYFPLDYTVEVGTNRPDYAGITWGDTSKQQIIAIEPATDWFEAFRQLSSLLEHQPTERKKVVFLDELPWLATKGSNFLSALEYFWNSWASARDDIILIVCGSAAAWMVNNLLRNRGGLHNRVTARMRIAPFTLAETEQFLLNNNSVYERYSILLLYMVFGGIPFYLEQVDTGKSAMQNINDLCFDSHAFFREEYKDLYASLFKKSERHIAVVEALATKRKGLSRKTLIKLSKLPDGGGLTRILTELEESNFIRRYRSFGKKEKDSLYQLIDFYSLFYLNFIKKASIHEEGFWLNAVESPLFNTWGGYAFEMVCLHHVRQIKKALEIGGVQTSVYSWQSPDAQIDLVIDRKDQTINLCEMKFSVAPFKIDKKYAANLRNKIAAFRTATETRKSIFLTMVSTYGIANNLHASMVQKDLAMDILFE